MKMIAILFEDNLKSIKFLLLLSLLFLPAVALANNLSDQINAENNKLKSLDKQIDDLDKDVGKPLAAEKARLLDTDELLKGAEKNLKAKYNDWNNRVKGPNGYSDQFATHQAKIAPFNARTKDYNSRCSGTFEDKSHVDACNQEKARLDAEADSFQREFEHLKNLQGSLRREKADLDSFSESLQARRNDLKQATLNWAEKMKNYNANHNELVAAYKQTLAQIQQLIRQYSECIKLLPADATDEAIKHHCGNVQFDNVRKNIQELWDIKPPWSVTTGQ